MDRTIRLLALGAVATGCPYDPNTVDPTEITTNDTDGSSSASGASMSATNPSDPSDPSTPTTTDPSDPDTGSTGVPANCGDGNIDGDEVCDDGVNDGSYGGCLEDCSDFAGRCGDGEMNGPEVCDDGVNDGSYAGCAADCGTLGPHCGDSEINGPEDCDNGDANANGSGCNIDCVTSGSQVGMYMRDDLDFCDGVFVTRPAFRDNGTTVVAATGYCNDDSRALIELNSDATESQVFDDLLLPQTPVRQATTIGDDWLLSAYGCNYLVSATGELTEICADGRLVGDQSLEAADDGSYVALNYDAVGLFPSGSPMAGDSPTWTAAPQDNAYYDYTFVASTFGASGSVAVAGYVRDIGANDYYGYVARYTSAGNLVSDYWINTLDYVDDVVHAPDGTVALVNAYPSYSVIKLDASYSEEWTVATGANSNIAAAFDSTGALVLLFQDAASMQPRFLKRAPDGATLWDQTITGVNYSFRMAIDPDDAIWVVDASCCGPGSGLIVQKFAP